MCAVSKSPDGEVGVLIHLEWWGKGTSFSDKVQRVGAEGSLVAERCVVHVISMSGVSEQILMVNLLLGKRIVNVVSAYAPQSGRSLEKKDAFWDQTVGVIARLHQSEVVVVGSGLNGHLGLALDGHDSVHGGMGFGTRNAEGKGSLSLVMQLRWSSVPHSLRGV